MDKALEGIIEDLKALSHDVNTETLAKAFGKLPSE